MSEPTQFEESSPKRISAVTLGHFAPKPGETGGLMKVVFAVNGESLTSFVMSRGVAAALIAALAEGLINE